MAIFHVRLSFTLGQHGWVEQLYRQSADFAGVASAGGWHHLCVTYNAGTTTLYLDGASIASGANALAFVGAVSIYMSTSGGVAGTSCKTAAAQLLLTLLVPVLVRSSIRQRGQLTFLHKAKKR